jgi:hypothetical protein
MTTSFMTYRCSTCGKRLDSFDFYIEHSAECRVASKLSAQPTSPTGGTPVPTPAEIPPPPSDPLDPFRWESRGYRIRYTGNPAEPHGRLL